MIDATLAWSIAIGMTLGNLITAVLDTTINRTIRKVLLRRLEKKVSQTFEELSKKYSDGSVKKSTRKPAKPKK